ncbi:unnamed protein product [Rodentolepis nana]|uniref:Essential MCU regulator, mitochondrial n=1 Tax=Rodentolepis nana TaxID=102285 RepID=A0A0R3TS12_RODNA|nr:unnamed protein product [Rodentolepis nana]
MGMLLEGGGRLRYFPLSFNICSHRAKRKLRKKLARQLVRRRNAQIRDQSSANDIITEEEVARIEAEEKLERQRHDEEEQKWIERERIAQEIFAQKKALEEAEQKSKQDMQKNAPAKEIIIKKSSLQMYLNLPPNHCPEPPHLDWKRDELCQFFLKTGACRYGDRCSRHHLIPPLHPSDIASLGSSNAESPRLILIIENMFNHFSFHCDPLECEETQLLLDYHDFYADVRPVLESVCGGPLEVFRCCRNALPHLRGNVYIQFTQDPTIASDVALRLSSQRYDGKPLATRLAYLCEGWESAICGCHLRGNCPRGDMSCNYLHVFPNPNEKASDVLDHSSSHRAGEKLSRESRSSRSGRNSERHSRAHRRNSMSRSHSRERHGHKSHRRESHNRTASVSSSPSIDRYRSKERSRRCKEHLIGVWKQPKKGMLDSRSSTRRSNRLSYPALAFEEFDEYHHTHTGSALCKKQTSIRPAECHDTGAYNLSGSLRGRPKTDRYGTWKSLCIAVPFIILGGCISMKGAAYLEEHDIFVPEDDD